MVLYLSKAPLMLNYVGLKGNTGIDVFFSINMIYVSSIMLLGQK